MSREHERMIRSAQRRMLRLTVQNKRKYKKKTQSNKEEKDMKKDKQPETEKSADETEDGSHKSSGDETVEGSSSTSDCDQDSDVSFLNDTDEEIDTAEIEQEEWIEYIKRSTAEAEELMKNAKIPCWIETHRGMKWRLAMRTPSLPRERWARKAAEWIPCLSSQIKTNRAVGRPQKRWEDEINDFFKPEGTEATKRSDI